MVEALRYLPAIGRHFEQMPALSGIQDGKPEAHRVFAFEA
jgi:hypothetical protein